MLFHFATSNIRPAFQLARTDPKIIPGKMRNNEVFLSQLDNALVTKVPGSFSRLWHEFLEDFPPATKVVTAKESNFSCSIITTSHRIIITLPLQPGFVTMFADNMTIPIPICASIPYSHLISVTPNGGAGGTTGVTMGLNFYYPLQLNLFIPVGQNSMAAVDEAINHWRMQVCGIFLRPMSVPILNAATGMETVGKYMDAMSLYKHKATLLREPGTKNPHSWQHYSISRMLKALEGSGCQLRVDFTMLEGQTPEMLAEPLNIPRYQNIKAYYQNTLNLGDSEGYAKASIDSLLGGEVDALKGFLSRKSDENAEKIAKEAYTQLHVCINKDYQTCETYPYLFLLPHQAIIRPGTFTDDRYICVAGFIDEFPIFRSGNPVVGIGSVPISDFFTFYIPQTRYKRVIVFSLGSTTYVDTSLQMNVLPPNKNGVFVDYSNFIRILQIRLPFPEEVSTAFNAMWLHNLVQPTQFFSSEIPSNWNKAGAAGQRGGGSDLYQIAADLFDNFHVKTIKEDNDFQYTVRVEETGWLDYIISFVATARMILELMRDDDHQNMILLSGELETFWTPILLILVDILGKKEYRTIKGLLTLLHQYLPSFGLPVASCMNFEGSQIAAQAPLKEQHYKLIAQRTNHVPIIPLLIDCISLLVHYSRPAFGFGEGFLMHLTGIIYSALHGDFLFDNEAERYFLAVPELTGSLYAQETIDYLCKRFETPIVVDALELSSWPTISKFWSLGLDFSA